MTPPTDPVTATLDEIACLHDTLDRVLIAATAVKLALQAARDAPHTARLTALTTEQTLESWAAANLLMRSAFEALYHEVRDSLDVIRLMLPLPRD